MRRCHSPKLVLICAAILGVALVAETAAPLSSPLHAPAKDGETATPVLDPAIYHHAAQVIWVVSDLDRVVEYWQRLGVHNIHRDGLVSFPSLTYRGTPDPATAKQATANVADLEIKWIQPVQGGKFWSDGLRQHGDGIHVLGYIVRSPQDFDDQVKYFASKGVGLVVQDSWQGTAGRGRTAYLDTATQGGGTHTGPDRSSRHASPRWRRCQQRIPTHQDHPFCLGRE